ncbi:MAG: hypothetical protein ACI9DC_002861 [Gammaproteobacteria bacterium]|jgi:hypothetical protein
MSAHARAQADAQADAGRDRRRSGVRSAHAVCDALAGVTTRGQ